MLHRRVIFVAVIFASGCSLIATFDGFVGSAVEEGGVIADAGDASLTDAPLAAKDSGGEDAPSVIADASCVDASFDSLNCGTCGHSCLGGACNAGTCMPVAIATGLSHPIGIAIDSNAIYVTCIGTTSGGDGALLAFDKDGTNPRTLAKQAGNPLVNEPTAISLDSTQAYFTNIGAGVVRIAKDGSDNQVTTVVSSSETSPTSITMDQTNGTLYWTTAASSPVVRRAQAGAVSTLYATGSGQLTTIVTDGTTLFFENAVNNEIFSMPKAGCGDASTCATLIYPLGSQSPDSQYGEQALVLDPNNLYFTDGIGNILWIPKGGGNPKVVGATNPHLGANMVIDGNEIVWTVEAPAGGAQSGRVMRANKLDGTGVTTLSTGDAYPRGLAVDSVATYWVDQGTPTNFSDYTLVNIFDAQDGKLMRLAK